MRGVNKVILVGRLGQDPESRAMPSGGTVANISVATSETWKDKQSGDPQERTEWHRVTMFGRLAEIVAQYLRKGSSVYIEGSLRTRKWQDKTGADRYSTDIIASEMQMLSGRGEGSAPGDAPAGRQGASASRETAGRTASAEPQSDWQRSAQSADFDDQIPF